MQLFVPVAVFCMGGAALMFHSEVDADLEKIRSSETVAIRTGATSTGRVVQSITRDLANLVAQEGFIETLSGGNRAAHNRLEEDWLVFSRTKEIYDQIRWLDAGGEERLRVNFNGGKPVAVPAAELQNKGKRYYFADTIKLARSEYFISPLDLNMEHGRIELPVKPVIRISTPVFDRQGRKRGIIILNYLAQGMLREFGRIMGAANSRAGLLNREGYWLKGPTADLEWGFMYRRPNASVADRHADAWKRILASEHGQFEDDAGLWTFATVYPLLEGQKTSTGTYGAFAPSRSRLESRDYFWKAALLLSSKEYGATRWRTGINLSVATFTLLVGLFIGCWWLARAWARQEESETRFRNFANVGGDRFWETDENHRFVYLPETPGVARRLSNKAGIGKRRWELPGVDPEDGIWKEHRADLDNHRIFHDFRYSHLDDQGRLSHIRIKGLPHFDGEGNFKGYRGMASDETNYVEEREKADQALKESEEKYRSLFEGGGDPVALFEPHTFRFLDVNEVGQKLLGYRREELLELTALDVDFERTEEDLRRAIDNLRERNGITFETRVRHKDGSVIPVETTTSLTKFGGREVVQSITRDISERKKAEEKLEMVQNRLEDAFNSISDGVLLYGADDRLILSAAGPKRPDTGMTNFLVLGASFESIVRASVKRGHIPEAMERPEEWIRKRMEYHRSKKGVFELLNKDGRWIQLSEHLTREGGTLVIRTDVTERKQLETQLSQAQKLETIGTLAGGIAHDLNNILTPIFGSVEFALQDASKDGQLHKDLITIKNASRRAKETVKQILTFSRHIKQDRKPINLREVSEEGLRLLRISLPSTIEIRQSFVRDCPPISADPSQIHQVIMNLGVNAQHAMKERGGVLEIGLDLVEVERAFAQLHPNLKDKSYVRLSVSDTGEGMDEGTLRRVFEPFFTTREVGEGTGLGLATVHGIVKAHEGEITVESERGKGTTFCLYFPLAAAQEVRATEEIDVVSGRGEHILLVDDEADNVEMFTRILEGGGYRVTAMTSSKAALETFRAHPTAFDLVVTDQTMPHMTGKQMAKEMTDARPELPIILMSGFSEDLSEKSRNEIGIRARIIKPVTIDQLCLAVQHCVEETGKVSELYLGPEGP